MLELKLSKVLNLTNNGSKQRGSKNIGSETFLVHGPQFWSSTKVRTCRKLNLFYSLHILYLL